MIDLHAHVLPGIDDGPETVDESLSLLRRMEEQGVRKVVTAAHALDGRYNATRDAVLRATEQVNAALQAAGLGITVLPGMELYLGYDLLRAVTTGQAMGLSDGRYLVVELPSREFPMYTERAMFELLMKGYRPILNHPERNRAIQKNPDLMRRLADQGVGAMVTAASLLGRFGYEPMQLAKAYLREEVATMVVSDAHNLSGRAPLLPDGLVVARECGKLDQTAEESLLS